MAQLDQDSMIMLCKRVQDLERQRVTLQIDSIALVDAIHEYRERIETLLAERDEARRWARSLLARCELEHWITMRAASWQRDDEATIAALTATRDALQAENAALALSIDQLKACARYTSAKREDWEV